MQDVIRTKGELREELRRLSGIARRQPVTLTLTHSDGGTYAIEARVAWDRWYWSCDGLTWHRTRGEALSRV